MGLARERRRDAEGALRQTSREVDFVASLGSRRYYIQSAYALPDEQKRAQEKASLLTTGDSFKKIIVVKDVVNVTRDEDGIVAIGLFDFLLREDSLGLKVFGTLPQGRHGELFNSRNPFGPTRGIETVRVAEEPITTPVEQVPRPASPTSQSPQPCSARSPRGCPGTSMPSGCSSSRCAYATRGCTQAPSAHVHTQIAGMFFGTHQVLADADVGFRHNMADTDIGIGHIEEEAMERAAMKDLVAWKDSPARKPLVVNGARQVGKTWLVLEFGRLNFEHVAHVVLLDNEQMQRIFDASLDPDRLLTLIGAATGTNPNDGKTLVFLDEIQECPRAVTALKLFCEKRPDVPVVAAGSLLGVALNRRKRNEDTPASWPVGKVDFLDLHPMTFAEFVRAAENPQLADLLRTDDPELADAMAETLSELLRLYLFVGGMPEAVQAFADSRDLAAVRRIQNALLTSYELDFAKHTETALDAERVRQTWRSLPVQLARETNMRRFVYAQIQNGGRGRDYRDAVSWLVDAGLAVKVARVSKPGLPLRGYEEEQYFKLYLHDVGLLGAATNLSARTVVEGNALFTEYKGAYAEQYVCQELVAAGLKPRYWSADGKNVKGEVDFVVELDGAVFPLEVKANTNVDGSSLGAFARRYGIERAMRLSMLGYRDQGWLVNVPLYAAGMLPRLLETDAARP